MKVTFEAIEAAIDRMTQGTPTDPDEEVYPEAIQQPPDAAAPQLSYQEAHRDEMRQTLASRIELGDLRRKAWVVRRPEHIDLVPAREYENPDSGRRRLAPEPALVDLGRYARRSRRYAEKSQQRVADEANVSQSSLSRLERGVAPMLPLEKLLAIQRTYGRLFPLGFCPHEHPCAWQPIRPPADPSEVATYIQFLLSGAAPDIGD